MKDNQEGRRLAIRRFPESRTPSTGSSVDLIGPGREARETPSQINVVTKGSQRGDGPPYSNRVFGSGSEMSRFPPPRCYQRIQAARCTNVAWVGKQTQRVVCVCACVCALKTL